MLWTYIINSLNRKEFLERFSKTNYKKEMKKILESKIVIKRKGDKSYMLNE